MEYQLFAGTKDIDQYLIIFLDIYTLCQIRIINKYYHNFINNCEIINEIDLFKKKHKLKFHKNSNTFSALIYEWFKILTNDPLKIFELCCQNGWINFAKYLIRNYEININNLDQWVFVIICKNGSFELAQWIYKICIEKGFPIKLDKYDDWAFRYCCAFNHLDIAKWLCSINKKYYLEEKNRKIDQWHIKNIIQF